MATKQRLFDKGTVQGERRLREFGEECKNQRVSLGLPQQVVADAVRVDRSIYSKIERGKWPALTFVTAARIAAVLGLDLSVKTFPGGPSIRDASQTPRLQVILQNIGRPLRHRAEVPLPKRDGTFEQRAWDCVLYGDDARTTIEFETALHDVQAQLRRYGLKRRDDPSDNFLLVIADTRHNRAVLREYADLFADLPRLRTANVLKALRAGQHPPSGYILLDAPVPRRVGRLVA